MMSATDSRSRIRTKTDWILLSDATQYTRTPPDLHNFSCTEANLKRRLLAELFCSNVETPAIGLHLLDNAYASDLTFVYQEDGSLFEPSSRDHIDQLSIDEVRSLQNCETPTIQGEAAFIFKAGKNNYGHMIVEMLPKLESIVAAGVGKILLLVPILPPELDTLLTFILSNVFGGWPIKRFETPLIQVERLIYPSAVARHGDRKSSKVLDFANRVLACVPKATSVVASTKIYVSRRKCKNRVLLNEEEIENIFARHGFTVFHPEDHVFADQVTIFSQASFIAGPVGAALTSIVFAPQSARILVLDPGTHDIFFFDLACLKGQAFVWLFAAQLEAPSLAALHASWSIRADLVESVLRTLDG